MNINELQNKQNVISNNIQMFHILQLAENSRAWGKERADLMIRLNEADNGFGRANGMVLHDYPVHVSISIQTNEPVF